MLERKPSFVKIVSDDVKHSTTPNKTHRYVNGNTHSFQSKTTSEKHVLPLHSSINLQDHSSHRICGISRKHLSLVILTIQNASLTLMTSYSRSAPVRHDVTMYIASTAVFFAEVAKILICLLVLYIESGYNFLDFVTAVQQQVLGQPREVFKLIFPSILYALQNNLLYVALTNLEAATFQVTYQMKILATAVCSVILLGRRLPRMKWFALILLMIGVALVQLQHVTQNVKTHMGDMDTSTLEVDSDEDVSKGTFAMDSSSTSPTTRKAYPLLGLLAVLLSCMSSGIAGCYFEKVLKTTNTSMWVRNIQLGLSSLLFSFMGMMMNDYSRIHNGGLLQGYDILTWGVVANQAFGGLLVAVVVKYADNILKGFATSLSIVLSSIFSFYFLGFNPRSEFLLGTSIVMYATWLFANGDRKLTGAETGKTRFFGSTRSTLSRLISLNPSEKVG